MAALAKDFHSRLGERVVELKDAAGQMRKDPADKEALDALRVLAHKLAGAGATFGYDELSKKSKEFELMVAGALKEDRELLGEEQAHVQRYLSEVELLSKKHDPENEMESSTDGASAPKRRTQKAKKTILLLEHDDEVVRDLARQLGYFGYAIQQIDRLEELTEGLEEGQRRLVFINAVVLRERPDAQKFLSELRKEYREQLSLIFTSETDDFDTRLNVVRSGGDAFFLKPFDVGKLIDRIESLTAQKESVPYHILIVDDDPEQVAYYALVLQQAGMITSVALDPKRVIAVLNEAKPELVLMDMYMPGCNGMELSSIIRQHEAFVSIPIVFLSVETDMDRQLAAIRLGGDDFLTKPIKPEHLVLSITTRAARTRNIRYFMERDSLTGLLNHTNLKENLSREVMRAERMEAPVSFAMIDVDHFKNVNDTYGHLTGDGVLKSLSRLLQERLRRTDIIGRYGGEEFGVILLNTGAEIAAQIMNEIRENFSHIRQQAEGEEFFVTFSCGVASFPEIKHAAAMGAAADYALYEAKESGRNRIVVSSESPAS
ncbi:MAG TPA: diguanylate cyclase [Spirochaetia bacterium]|nr:diguanylate cyclase [Spirochaetia bacterium]